MEIEATPKDGLTDEPVAVRLTGLPANRQVTLIAAMRDHQGRKWQSRATFLSNPGGTIDLATERPISGTYKEADTNGLTWSMVPEPELSERSPFDLSRTTPLLIELTCEIDGQSAARVELTRRLIGHGITRTEVRDNGLVATLFHKPFEPRPAIIYLGGSGGGLSEGDPALLASRGFTVMSLAYFGIEKLNSDLCEIPLEYFERAIQWLRRRKSVLADRIAVVGRSKGGELSLLLGATFPEIKAVIAYVPSGVVWMGIGKDPACMMRSSWTLAGAPIPFVPPAALDQSTFTAESVDLSRFYRASMRNETAMKAAEIAVERINGPILLLSGLDDKCWPSTELAELAVARLERSHFEHFYEHIAYPGAGHLIEPCIRPTTVNEIFHPVIHMPMALGGSATANARANADSWQKVLSFLHKHFA